MNSSVSDAHNTQPETSSCRNHVPVDYGEGTDCALVFSHTANILRSSAFSGSERMRRFLRFAVEKSLAGDSTALKEYVLGIEIFDRKQDFDPRIDPIVRVEARRLRSKLKAYYEGEGRGDTMIIELPTGSYVPRFRRRNSPDREANIAPRAAKSVLHSAPLRNILVLPFANLSLDPDTKYFSDELTEELINALTKAVGLRIIGWNTAVKIKDSRDDIRSIGRQLNVSRVLTGSVRTSDHRLRIIVHLIDTASGYYLWSETYNRQVKDLFAMREEVSRAIVATWWIRLTGT